MGFLAPIFLVAAGAVAIPFLLHLFHRHDPRRVSFPALRYLQRTEKEHARRIRLRQLLLLLVRVAVILLLVAAGARLFVRGAGSGHEPTAVVVILDNSMSSGLVVGDERMLDRLKRLALEGVGQATPDDQLWVIRVGEPWEAAPPGGPAEAADRIAATTVSTVQGDLTAALGRARELLLSSRLAAREIHLLSDLQGTAFRRDGDEPPAGETPVVVYRPAEPPPVNRYLQEILVGGGLSPLAGQRTEISVTVGATDLGEGEEVPLRIVIDEAIRGATTALPGRTVVLPVGPFPEGLVQGFVETDPDALRADDRRHFTFRVRPPPVVARAGEEAFFLEQALSVLEDGGRVRPGDVGTARVLFTVGGDGLELLREGQAVVIFPPSDPTLLPALNRRLAQAGIPWRVERPDGSGEAEPGENLLPIDLDGVRVQRRYALEPAGEEGVTEVSVRLTDGEPWIVTGRLAGGPYLLVGSPVAPEASTLPVSAAMVPLLEWMTGHWPVAESAGRRIEAGQPLVVPSAATHVEAPDGSRHALDGTSVFRETREAGVYVVLDGDDVVEHLAVAPPLRESLLARLDPGEAAERIGSRLRVVEDPRDWPRQIFVNRQGPELWRPLLALAVLLLLVEAWIAAPGRTATARGGRGQPGVEGRDPGRREVRAGAA